ncbi:hypothetical protein F941_00349 [Acinetobacter bouvetii DSM 14964 = CIP 107468]|uniref:Uncharacterized protein n=1 Tax=Acinetobacter bouvetii DSM 14964 = CIP 107468 TaxID=1120925 RepID=N9DTZ1_9GAMM|nr:hypothetical protein [Acinetobacter bouvetii]ENV83943.1 hypothetical protein F941_00349 [Acinetobacter bouvetii DSM 14964 = CIP 107468]BCU65996.1 hypothetical protein ACBO_27870 [Acinetobacter bouvetii]
MKIEKRKLTYTINGIKFIDLDCLEYAVQKKLFNASSYQYLLKLRKKKGDKDNLISFTFFREILRKLPKKQPCWCLSNLNFIDCHFHKEKMPQKTENEINIIFKKNFSYKSCLHQGVSNCEGSIIKAHSISKKGSLQYISDNQHVYGMKFEINGFNFKKIGIRNASTFTGFCKRHDEILFSSFEKNNFEKTSKQLFDLCYRAICIEYNAMQSVSNLLTLIKKSTDNSKDISSQITSQIEINSQIAFYNLGLKYSNYYKRKMEESYKKNNYDNLIQHYIFELHDRYPRFQSSSCFNLDFDLNGVELQNLNNAEKQSKNFYVNCIHLNGKGYFILSWFTENNEYGESIIQSILNEPLRIEDKLFSLVFLYIHNTYVSPSWFESLSEEQRLKINELQNFWNEKNNFNTTLIQDNMNSLKVKNHYYLKTYELNNIKD